MKIGHIILTAQNGGAERVFIDYIKILTQIGHKNYAIIKNNAPYFKELDDAKIEYIKTTNKWGYFDIFSSKNIANFIEKNQLDIIIAHAGRSVVLANKAIKKIKNRKVILVAVNHSNNIKRSLLADIIISVNREIFFKTIDAKRSVENSFILYNGIDLEDNNSNSLGANFEAINFLAKPVINIGLIGRFHKAKGFDIAIEAFKILKNKTQKNLKLKIAGEGIEELSLKAKIADLKLENDVEFFGWVKDSKDFFSQIDIFILPSKVETFGLVILEAMKYGKPIVATNCDGPKEILRDNIDGLIINLEPTFDLPSRISDAINSIISDNDLANNLVKNAYKRLEARFTKKILKQNLAELFKIDSK